ncbi:3-prime end of ExtraCellular Mutant protein [Lecanora helva]
MAVITYLLPAVALASTVAAQCSNSATLTITASSDASDLASCTTYSGSVAIPTGLSVNPDGNGHQQLSVDGVQKITGNLTVTNVDQLASLSFSELKSIGGFELGQLTVLSELSFPQLTQVGAMNFTALPALQSLSFGGTGVTQADSILITNTGLSSLQGINNLKSVTSFNINNNQALQNISLMVTSIKGSLDIEANDGFVSGLMTTFPMLETAKNMTFRNCSSVSLPSLANVSEDLGFYGNTMKTFMAPNLTTVGGLVFVDNTELTNISIPDLTSVNQSYQIANNTMLKMINGFPKLRTVKGALDFEGNFTEVDLPALQEVDGAFTLSTSATFDCSAFDEDKKSKKVIRGKYSCKSKQAKPGSSGSKASSSSGSSPTGQSAAGHVDVSYPVVLGTTSFLAGLLALAL